MDFIRPYVLNFAHDLRWRATHRQKILDHVKVQRFGGPLGAFAALESLTPREAVTRYQDGRMLQLVIKFSTPILFRITEDPDETCQSPDEQA